MGTSLSTIKLLCDYHLWANHRMRAACETLTMEQWSRSLGHSWGSVHGLLTHMFAAEVIWLARCKGNSPKALHQPAEYPTYADLAKAWAKKDAELLEFVGSLTEKSLGQDITYVNTRGISYTNPLGLLLLHLVNHSNHHRGELAAMLTVLNVPHPEDDLIFYYREKAK